MNIDLLDTYPNVTQIIVDKSVKKILAFMNGNTHKTSLASAINSATYILQTTKKQSELEHCYALFQFLNEKIKNSIELEELDELEELEELEKLVALDALEEPHFYWDLDLSVEPGKGSDDAIISNRLNSLDRKDKFIDFYHFYESDVPDMPDMPDMSDVSDESDASDESNESVDLERFERLERLDMFVCYTNKLICAFLKLQFAAADDKMQEKNLADYISTIIKDVECASLNLNFNKIINQAAARSIAEGLKNNHTVTSLNLSFNKINQAAASSIAEGLKNNDTITSLNLTLANISKPSAKAITEVLKYNQKITKLKLNFIYKFNKFTDFDLLDKGFGARMTKIIAEALKTNKMITSFYLSCDNMTNVGAQALADMLETNTTLRKFYVDEYQINKDIYQNIKKALQRNNNIALKQHKMSEPVVSINLLEEKNLKEEVKEEQEKPKAEENNIIWLHSSEPPFSINSLKERDLNETAYLLKACLDHTHAEYNPEEKIPHGVKIYDYLVAWNTFFDSKVKNNADLSDGQKSLLYVERARFNSAFAQKNGLSVGKKENQRDARQCDSLEKALLNNKKLPDDVKTAGNLSSSLRQAHAYFISYNYRKNNTDNTVGGCNATLFAINNDGNNTKNNEENKNKGINIKQYFPFSKF